MTFSNFSLVSLEIGLGGGDSSFSGLGFRVYLVARVIGDWPWGRRLYLGKSLLHCLKLIIDGPGGIGHDRRGGRGAGRRGADDVGCTE